MGKLSLAGVKRVVLIASGKGGVGKSTVAVNLALAVASQQQTWNVGLLDADVYGPSVPKMMNLSGGVEVTTQNLLKPMSNYGIKCMSMGFLVDEKQPVVWRGLMVTKAIKTLLWKVHWGPTDLLLIDLPPGTGDVQLTITEDIRVSGVVIVSSPQDVSLADARKGAESFLKLQPPVKVLGLINNFAHFTCANCGHRANLFGSDEHLRQMADQLKVPLLGEIPIDESIAKCSDSGQPVVVSMPKSSVAESYQTIAGKLLKILQITDGVPQ